MNMATERLYFTDSHLLDFEAQVVETLERDGRRAIVLDRTAFHPTGGGQPHDTGTFAGAQGEWRVDEVVADEESGRILHFVSRGDGSAALPASGAALRGRVDAARRRDLLQQHSGQHILSQAFVQACGAATHSFHLGTASSTIDVDPRVDDAALAMAVDLANDVVFSDRPTRVHLVGADELERFKIRRQTFHGERIRLVEIEGFDVSTCGGTHAQRTGEIGLIAALSVEKAKGLQRVEFVCGGRALRALDETRRVVGETARRLSVSADELPAQVARLLESEKAARKRARTWFELAADAQAAELLARAEPVGAARVVVATLADHSFEEAQLLGKKLTERGPVVALLAVADPATPKLLFSRSSDPSLVAFSLDTLVKQVAEHFNGRGGGSPTFAQASIDAARLSDALALARSLLASL